MLQRVIEFVLKRLTYNGIECNDGLKTISRDNINCMFLKSSNSIVGICLTTAASDGGLRRASSIRRNYATTWQKKSATVNIKIQSVSTHRIFL
jgi:hypothetical protein